METRMKVIGIDWAQAVHDVCLLAPDGSVIDRWRAPHDAEGVRKLLARMEREGGPTAVLVGIESGAPLLLDQLLAAGYTVYALNPKVADRMRDRHSIAGAKDDTLDAYVLADAVRTERGRFRPVARDSDLAEEIRARDRARSRRVQERARLQNQLRDVLRRYYPVLLDLDRPMTDRFLLELLTTYPEPAKARGARVATLEKLLASHRIRVLKAAELAERLRAPALACSVPVASACRDEALDLAAQITLLNTQIEAADAALEELLGRHPDRKILRSLPGLGDCLAVRVIAELGDSRDRFADRSSLQSFCGSAPVTRRSGKGRPRVAMRKGCNRVLQAALYAMARASRARSAWANAYYESYVVRGGQKGAAARALSNKWAKIIWTLLRTGEAYDEAKHLATLKAYGVPWAKDLRVPEAA